MQHIGRELLTKDTYSYRKEISEKIITLLEYYVNRHSKVLVVRFDIHYPLHYSGVILNTNISTCLTRVVRKYDRQGLDPCYIWVREQHRSHNPHYHCALLLNGQKVRTYRHVFISIEEAWGRILGYPVKGCVHHCFDLDNQDANGKIIRRDASIEVFTRRYQEVTNQLSYLAKKFSKAPANDGKRNFGCSRIQHRREYIFT